MPPNRSLAEQVTHRFGYAIGLLLGAERTCQFGKAAVSEYGMPTFLLLGFCLENAFASYLMACEHKTPRDYKSHNLEKAMLACKDHDLFFTEEAIEFVRKFTPLHTSFAFRYPENMDRADLGSFQSALQSTKSILRDVHTGLKIRGIDPAVVADSMSDSVPDD